MSDRWPGQVLERGARHPGPARPLPTRLPLRSPGCTFTSERADRQAFFLSSPLG